MADAATAAAGTGGDSSTSRMTSSFVKVGDRMRFSVELRPGETTIVSWKKFTKDASKSRGASSSSDAGAASAAPPANAPPSLESRLAPGDTAANDLKDVPAPNRFNAVIEKIERLYMGKDSSDDEDLADVPDDDQYDTEDSFIDDEELDEYFEVDKSKTKHDGYFVNRGTLEKVSEPLQLSIQQPKKRRRKESTKAPDDDDLNHRSNKLMKVGRKPAGQFDSSLVKNMFPVNQGPCVNNVEELKNPIQSIASETRLLKVPNGDKALANFTPLRTSNGKASSSLAQSGDKQKTSMLPTKNPSSKLKENIAEESVLVMQQTDKSRMCEKIDLNLPDSKHTMQSAKTSLVNKKEGSSLKPKANLLEKAIRELEKLVAELRPPTSDAQDTDAAASIKRRLPREIKLKLAKVAKANASNGKVSKELLNHLMGIVGHWCQIRTLKRHLNVVDTSLSPKQEKDDKAQQIKNEIMMNTSLSPKHERDDKAQQIKNEIMMNTSLSPKLEGDDKAQQIKEVMMNTSLSPKQEKDDKFQQIKKEIMELIQARAPSLISKGSEQQCGGSGDAHEAGNPDKALKGKLYMDVVLEDKLCDIYDVFVDGLDKDAAPQVRKLYAELAELWPRGFMDNHGIKRAICRAKERKRALNGTNKEKEKIKRKKVVASEMEKNHVHVESGSLPQPQPVEYSRVVGTDPTNGPIVHQNRFIPSTTASSAAPPSNPTTIPSTHLPNFERAKHEKVKAADNTSLIVDGVVVKKKVKKRAEISGESNKLSSHHSDDNRQKQHKHGSTVPLQSAPQNESGFDVFQFDPLT